MKKIRIKEIESNSYINLVGGFRVGHNIFPHNDYRVFSVDDSFVLTSDKPFVNFPIGVRPQMEDAMKLAYREAMSCAEKLKKPYRKAIIIDQTSRTKESQLEGTTEGPIIVRPGCGVAV